MVGTRIGSCLLCAGLALVSFGCAEDGNFAIFGYTTKPNYDMGIRTVRVPIFKNQTFYRGLEFSLTQAVVREIEAKTPYKVVGEGCSADTELTGNIVNYTKAILNRTQLNEVREAETTLSVEIVWRNLNTGEILSRPLSGKEAPPPPLTNPTPGAAPPRPPVVLVQSIGHFIPEIGGSLATAEKENVDRLAVQIVSMMEKGW
ncbi:MAG TPA: LPS assembly lipoprotein LptE [Gemmataceae bacterium]|nr:LPS assembly lipoprotein LptE [Gemmataceae bacterium]